MCKFYFKKEKKYEYPIKNSNDVIGVDADNYNHALQNLEKYITDDNVENYYIWYVE